MQGALLRKLTPCLKPDGIILCRESTVRDDALSLRGAYQVNYRTVLDYRQLFEQCGLSTSHVERNEPYMLIEMASELVEKWQAAVPPRFQTLQAVGHSTYFGLRVGYPWVTRLPKALGIAFPKLENHFFTLSEVEVMNMPQAPGKFAYRNLANAVSLIGVLPLIILFMDGGFQYVIPLIIYNNFIDDLDGVLAAALNIRSKFGADLDNVCDAVAHISLAMAVGGTFRKFS